MSGNTFGDQTVEMIKDMLAGKYRRDLPVVKIIMHLDDGMTLEIHPDGKAIYHEPEDATAQRDFADADGCADSGGGS